MNQDSVPCESGSFIDREDLLACCSGVTGLSLDVGVLDSKTLDYFHELQAQGLRVSLMPISDLGAPILRVGAIGIEGLPGIQRAIEWVRGRFQH